MGATQQNLSPDEKIRFRNAKFCFENHIMANVYNHSQPRVFVNDYLPEVIMFGRPDGKTTWKTYTWK
jgi:hypothetical protein